MMTDDLKHTHLPYKKGDKDLNSDIVYNFINAVYALQDLKNERSTCPSTIIWADMTTDFLLKMVSESENR